VRGLAASHNIMKQYKVLNEQGLTYGFATVSLANPEVGQTITINVPKWGNISLSREIVRIEDQFLWTTEAISEGAD